MFDAHRHGPGPNAEELPPRWGALIASSGPRQWAQIAESPPLPNVRYCYGLLPQEIQAFSDTGMDLEQVLQNLEKLITTQRDSAVGEIGIDDRFNQTVPMNSQLLLVERLIGLAQSLDRPAILHVVRADGLMLNLLKRMKPRIPLLWHGFLGSLENRPGIGVLGLCGFYCTLGMADRNQTAGSVERSSNPSAVGNRLPLSLPFTRRSASLL